MLTAEKLRSLNRKKIQVLAKKHETDNIVQKLSSLFERECGEEVEKKNVKEDNESILKEENAETAEQRSKDDEANEDVSKLSDTKDLQPSLATLHDEATPNSNEATVYNKTAEIEGEENGKQSTHNGPQKEHLEADNEKGIETAANIPPQNEQIETSDSNPSKDVDANDVHSRSEIEKKEVENESIANKEEAVGNACLNEESAKCEKEIVESGEIVPKSDEILTGEPTCHESSNVEVPTNTRSKDEGHAQISAEHKEKEETVVSEPCCVESNAGEVVSNGSKCVDSTIVPLQCDSQLNKCTLEEMESRTNNNNKKKKEKEEQSVCEAKSIEHNKVKTKTNVIRNGTSKAGDTLTKHGKDIKKSQPLPKPSLGVTKDRLSKQNSKLKIASLAAGGTSQKVEKGRSKTVDRPTTERPGTNAIPIANENKNGTNTREEPPVKTQNEQKQSNQIVKKTKFDYSNVKPKVDTGLKKIPGKQLKTQLLDPSAAASNNDTSQTKKPVKRSLSCIGPNENSDKTHKRPRVADRK